MADKIMLSELLKMLSSETWGREDQLSLDATSRDSVARESVATTIFIVLKFGVTTVRCNNAVLSS